MRLSMTCALVTSIFIAATVGAADSVPAPKAPTFRVETEVYIDDEVQPFDRHLILFDDGVIYDIFLDDDRVSTMYDPNRGRVILVDRQHRQQVVLSTSEMLAATAQARATIEAEGKGNEFGLQAEVVEQPPKTPGDPIRYQLSFGDTRYTTTTQAAKQPQVAVAYNQFVTLAGQLNVMLRRGTPPFARMVLGQHIAEMGHLPLRTELEHDVTASLKTRRYRAQLHLVEQLSVVDRERIAEFGKVLAECEPVSLADFQQ